MPFTASEETALKRIEEQLARISDAVMKDSAEDATESEGEDMGGEEDCCPTCGKKMGD